MELEQIEKQMEWLDEERRKDKQKIAELEEKLVAYEGKIKALDKKNTDVDSEVTRLKTTISRVDDFDTELADFRVESGRSMKNLEKQVKNMVDEQGVQLRNQIQGVENLVDHLRSESVKHEELDRVMAARVEEENRQSKTVKEIRVLIDELQAKFEEQLRQFRVQKEERLKDIKRITDLRGEVSALRKRLDQQRGRMDLIETDAKKTSTRMDEINSRHRQLIQEQKDFLEKENLRSAERENIWKNWTVRFEAVEAQAAEIDEQLKSLDATHRTIKRMESDVSDLSERVDRRVNEITEMQRLGEERFRQEWNTFKADDQKRWMNYTLSQKEQRGELERNMGKIEERLTILEDTTQEIQDQIKQLSTESGKQLQDLLAMTREWAAAYEQILDGMR